MNVTLRYVDMDSLFYVYVRALNNNFWHFNKMHSVNNAVLTFISHKAL